MHVQGRRRPRSRSRAVWWHKVEGATRPVLVVMPMVDAQHALEMTAAKDKHPVEAISAVGSHPTCGIGVRRLNRCADYLDLAGTEDLIERAAELRVAIVDEKPERLLIAELHHQVARLLSSPASVRFGSTGDVLDPSRRQ